MPNLEHLTDKNLYELWLKASPKNDAFLAFVGVNSRNRYNALKEHIAKNSHGLFFSSFSDIPDHLTSFSERFEHSAKIMNEKNAKITPFRDELDTFEKNLKSHTQMLLREKEIIPLGFEIPRKAKDFPLILPDDILTVQLNWENNDISFGSLKFEEVRFISIKSIKHLFASQIGIAPLSQKTGRPSTKQIIEQAFTDCCKLQKIDFTRYKKDAAFVVQSYIQATSPDIYNQGKGFSEQTIIKYISKEFDVNQLK